MKKRLEKQNDYIETVWELRSWFDKALFVMGWIFIIWFVLVVIGLMVGA